MNIPIIGTVWAAFKRLIHAMWHFAMQGWTWLVGLVVILVTAVSSLVNSVLGLFQLLIEKLAAITAPQSTITQSVGDWLTIANTIAPVQEAFGSAVLLSTLWAAMLVYRFIKSWVPTVS